MASSSNFDLTYNKLDVVAGGALSNATATTGTSTGSGVTKIISGGSNVSVSPSSGVGDVTISVTAGGSGTVSEVKGQGTVQGITLTGDVTTSGYLTLSGSLSAVDLTSQVTGTLPVGKGGTGAATLSGVLKGNTTSAISAASGSDLNSTFGTQTAKSFYAGPTSGADANPSFRAIAASDVPTLNQNTTGSAGSVTGLSVVGGKTLTANNTLTLSATDGSTLSIGGGGTLGSAAYTPTSQYVAASSGSAANLTLTGTLSAGGGVGTSGYFLQTTGTGVTWAAASGSSGVSSITGNNGITPATLTTGAVSLGLAAITPTSVNGITLTGSGTPTLSVTGTSSISGSNTGDQTTITGNAGTATKLATGRTIAITGDLAYTSPSFDGSANVTAGGTLASIVTAAGPIGSSTTTPVVTIDAKGRVTALSSATIFGTLPSGATTSQSLLYGTSAAGWYTEHFNVKAFGATGNGSTDDTSNINLAIAALNAAGGGVLYFPKGQYVVNSTYNGALTTISVPCRIIGDGHGHSASESATAILKYNNGSSNRNVFTLNTSNPANFEDLSIVFNAATTAYGIYLNGPTGTPVDYSTINRVSVVSPSGTSATGVYSYNGNNTRITNCYIAGNAYGIYLTSDLSDADSPDGGVGFITNCVIESNTSAGIYHTSAGGLNIVGNVLHSNAYSYRYVALNAAVTSDIIITSNWIDVFTYAISFEGPSSSGSLSNVIIADNSFATLTGFSFSGVNVIQVINGSSTWFHEFNISGNSFQYAQDNNGTAITLNNCYNGMIGSNIFFSPSSYTQTAVVINTTCSVIQCQPDQTFYLYTNGPAILDYQSFFGTSSSIYSLASATTITLPKVGLFTSLTGTTNVQTINGGWLSRRYRFIVPSGLSFVSGGNISTPITVGAAGVVDALYDGYTWSLH